MSSKVQLKQENVVGESVVLEDINPKTDTDAVTDLSSGSSMSETLDRIWDAINNKLSRVVNSVNGRTGVVVLKPEDVGLGNVDNISFATIKKEIIDALETGFSAKHIMLFNTMNDVENIILTNDKKYTDTPFYVQHVSDSNKKSRIGYFYFDISDNKLKYNTKDIATVGYTDNSIIYDENVNGNNLSGGGIGVNIWKYEDALKLYNDASGSKAESGLMIDKDALLPRVIYIEGMYKSNLPTAPGYDNEGFLYFDDEDIPRGTPLSEIYFVTDFTSHREKQYVYAYVKRKDLREGDLIICGFEPYTTVDTSTGKDVVKLEPSYNPLLVSRGTHIGLVKAKLDGGFKIYFYKIKHNVGWGLQNMVSHKIASDAISSYVTDTYPELKLTNGRVGELFANTSGLQVFYQTTRDAMPEPGIDYNVQDDMLYTVTPAGAIQTKYNIDMEKYGYGGLSIITDSSIAISPSSWFDKSSTNGSELVDNWANKSPHGKGNRTFSTYGDVVDSSGVLKDTSLLGVNVNKLITAGLQTSYRLANASGIKIIKTSPVESAPNITKTFFTQNGYSDAEATINISNPRFMTSVETGGIAVNVGKFLEIGNIAYKTSESSFDDGGKVNVRIGTGLTDDGENRIKLLLGNKTVKYAQNDGVAVNHDRTLIVRDWGGDYSDTSHQSDYDFLSVNYGKGLKISDFVKGYYKQDSSGYGRFYNDNEYKNEITNITDGTLYLDRGTQKIYTKTSTMGLQETSQTSGALEVNHDSTLKMSAISSNNHKLGVNYDNVTITKNTDGALAVKYGLGLLATNNEQLDVYIGAINNVGTTTSGLSFGDMDPKPTQSFLRLNLYGIGQGGTTGTAQIPHNSSIGIVDRAFTKNNTLPSKMYDKEGYVLVTRKRNIDMKVAGKYVLEDGKNVLVPENDINNLGNVVATYNYDPLDGCDTIEEDNINISTAVISATGSEITQPALKSAFFEIYQTDNKNIKIVLKLNSIKDHLKQHWND